MLLNPSRRHIAEMLEQFIATGGSVTQLQILNELIANAELSDRERAYWQIEALPMLESAFYVAIHSRRKANIAKRNSVLITALTSILTAVSATAIVPENQKYLPLLFVAIAMVVKGYIEVMAGYHQPEMHQLISRRLLDGLLGETTDRLTTSGRYAQLTEEQRYQLMTDRIREVTASAESQIQELIKSTLTSPDTCKDNQPYCEPQKQVDK